MDNLRSAHLSEEELAQFQDGELSGAGAAHVESCLECNRRLHDLQTASAAYVEYRDFLRGPSLPSPPRPWQSIDALIARQEENRSLRIFRWWPVAVLAAAACVALAVVVLQKSAERPSARASELLAQSARVELGEGRFIAMRVRGRTLLRPAVLTSDLPPDHDPEVARLRAAFDAAHYNYGDPLSARSFQSWRSIQRDPRDAVSVIDGTGEERMYRVQTDSPNGVLRRASLILRVRDLRPTGGAFEFESEGIVEMDEAGAPTASPARKIPPVIAGEPPVETPATPADVLHVLAALDEIGADAGEPIEVSQDAARGKVAVRANGLSLERRREVEKALKTLPRVAFDFDSPVRADSGARTAAPERSSTSIPAALRRQFEDRLGGPIAVQEVTDRVLDVSASVLGRAHAIAVLARQFPPPVEAGLSDGDRALLLMLRQRHIAELERLVGKIRTELKPLLTTSNQAAPAAARDNWQAQTSVLVAAAQSVDEVLNRLLAGSYSQSSGEGMLGSLTTELQRLESAIQACAF